MTRFQTADSDKAGIFYADNDADAPADTMKALEAIMKSIKLKG